MEPLAQFAQNVQRLRAERELTREQLAERSGLLLSYIAKLERGERQPGVLVIAKLAHGLGVDPGELFAGVTPPVVR